MIAPMDANIESQVSKILADATNVEPIRALSQLDTMAREIAGISQQEGADTPREEKAANVYPAVLRVFGSAVTNVIVMPLVNHYWDNLVGV